MAKKLELNPDLISKITATPEGKEALVTLLQDLAGNVVGATDDSVLKILSEHGLRIRNKPRTKGARQVAVLKRIFDNGGLDSEGKFWDFKKVNGIDRKLQADFASGKAKIEDYADTQMSGEQPILFPKVIQEVVREALEPQLVLTPLLQVLRRPNGAMITFPAVSSMTAGDLRVSENGEYPEGRLQVTGQMVAAKIWKHGIKVSMTDEMVRYSQWDVWGMHLKAAGRALARHKEQLVVNHVFSLGTAFFDNTQVGTRKTTGRDITGAYNGTFVLDDLFEMWADLVKDGMVPNLLLMHPFAWPIFARDPVMRNLAYLHGGPGVISNGYQGSPQMANFDRPGLMQNRELDEPINQATTYAPVPQIFPFGSLRIIISPFVPYDFTTNSTDIYLCDDRDLGVLVEDEGLVTESWVDPERDVKSTKLRERYGIASANNGLSVRIAKGCVVTKSFDFSLSTIQAAVTLGTSEFVV